MSSLGSLQVEPLGEPRPSGASATNRVFEIDPIVDPRWDQLARSSYCGSLFHSTPWLQVLRRTYGFPLRATVMEGADGYLKGGLVHGLISDVRGRRLISLPFSDFCDPLVADSRTWSVLVDALLRHRLPTTFRCLHNEVALSDDRFEQSKDSKWHGVDLDRSLDEMWESFHPASRRAIKKARKQGVEVHRAETNSDLREFYDLHGAIRTQKYRILAQPYSFFEAIWDVFLKPSDGFLLLARYQGRTIAGALYLRHRDTIYYKFNASERDRLHVRPNDLLVWEGLSRAKQEMGCRQLDFGLSGSDQEGLLRYKRKFATEEKLIRFMRHLPATWTQRSTEHEWSKILPELTEILTGNAVPRSVSEQASNLLYRLFA